MNVLIADDEPMTRALLRRVLTRDCGCTVSEAADGLAALSSCGSSRPDLLITDLRMPVMDGIELIEALRQVPALAAIPVVMMTAAREQGPVHRAIELGVTDYLLKPLQADRVADRLRSVVERVTRANSSADDSGRMSVLVADGHADFRQFVVAALGPHWVVHQAQTGVAALQCAVETRPGIVLVGGELGLLGPDLLRRKLRAAGELAETRIVAIVSKGGDAAIPEQADAVLIRTTVADDLRFQLGAIAGPSRKTPVALAAHPALRDQIAAAAEQVFGMMLQLEVQHTFEIQPRPVPQMIVASLAIELPDAAETLTMALRTDLASAARIAAGMRRDGPPPASEQDGALAAAADVLGIIAGRIKTSLGSSGARVEMQPPTREIAGAGDLSDGAPGRMQVTAHTADGGIQFVLQLTASAAGSPLRPDAAPVPVPAAAS
jgi:two-component system, chemotaxis family, chemotaxis protein CheY